MWTDWNRPGAEGRWGGVGWYRIINPLSRIENATIAGAKGVGLGGEKRVENALKMREQGNIWFFKYVDDWKPVWHLLAARDVCDKFIGKTKLVIDIDDDMFSVHPRNWAYKHHHPGSDKNEALKHLIENADALTVSTEPLRESMSRFEKPIEVLPNAIDPEIWDVSKKLKRYKVWKKDRVVKERNVKTRLRIGWVSSINHLQDTPIIMDAVKEVLSKYDVEFWVIGFPAEEFMFSDRVKLVLGTDCYNDFPAFYASLGIDISVAPLIDDKFNRGKSNIKWMEASMLDIPTVASNVYPYKHSIIDGETGFLAGSKNQWINKLSKLIEDKELRERMGRQAREAVLREYNIKDILDKYINFFEKL